VICDVIAPGKARITLTRSANLGNPIAPGTYPLVVERGPIVLRGRFTIR
jgi:hypothetical protein